MFLECVGMHFHNLKIHFYLIVCSSLNSALLSRCRVIVLNKLPTASIRKILDRALESKNICVRNEGQQLDSAGVSIEENAVDYLSTICDGDARTALNCLEIAISKHESEGLNTDSVTRFGEILKILWQYLE